MLDNGTIYARYFRVREQFVCIPCLLVGDVLLSHLHEERPRPEEAWLTRPFSRHLCRAQPSSSRWAEADERIAALAARAYGE